MTTVGGFLSYALMAVFVVNPLLFGMSGIDSILKSLEKPKNLAIMSAMVAAFSFAASIICYPIDYLMHTESESMPVRGIIFALIVLLLYLLAWQLLSKVTPTFYENFGHLLAPAAVNGATLAAPLLISFQNRIILDSIGTEEQMTGYSPFTLTLGIGLFAGLGFALAAWLISEGIRRTNNPDVSPLMRGAPILLVYIGLLALAFSCIAGSVPLMPLG